MNRKKSDYQKLQDMYQSISIKCKCGKKEVIPVWVDKQVCSWCGHYVYRNKKLEFEEKLKRELKLKNEKKVF